MRVEMRSSYPLRTNVREGIYSRAVVPQPDGARSAQRGYVLIALSLGLVFILGMAGLAVDIGRMYVTKSEAQSFADTSAFAAALELDGDRKSVV